jgi:Uncharacterised nucleotidyltransferase
MKTTEVHSAHWADQIPDDQWQVYSRVLNAVREAGVGFALGGAFAVATYTGQWRNTKDLDVYVEPSDRQTMVELLSSFGLTDMHERLAYDRAWIYRACQGETIVDVIWSMANYRAEVDRSWLDSGPVIDLRGVRCRVLSAEVMLWTKLFVLQRDRCDWPDIMNLLYACGPHMDWEHLLHRIDGEARLLSGGLMVFQWLCPGRAREMPHWLWERLRLPAPHAGTNGDIDSEHVRLLDSRPWFRGIKSRAC